MLRILCFSGPSLIQYLDKLPAVSRNADAPVRLPIVDRYKVCSQLLPYIIHYNHSCFDLYLMIYHIDNTLLHLFTIYDIFFKDMGTIVLGKVESGTLRKAQTLTIMPNKVKCTNYFKILDSVDLYSSA